MQSYFHFDYTNVELISLLRFEKNESQNQELTLTSGKHNFVLPFNKSHFDCHLFIIVPIELD